MTRTLISLDRRALLLGAAGLTCAPQPLHAQDGVDPPIPDLAPEVIALLPNQITRLAARVMINDQGPFDFVVDSGANRTTLAQSVADRLGLPTGPEVVVHGVTAAVPAPTVGISRLRFAGDSFENLTAPVFSDQRLRAEGLLGLDVLGQYRVTLNMVDRTLQVGQVGIVYGHSERSTRLGQQSTVRAERRFGQLVFDEAWVDRVRASSFIDSGGQYTIGNTALLRAIDAQSLDQSVPRWAVPIIGVTGQRRMGELAVIRSLRLGSTVLRRTPVVFSDLHAFDYLGLSASPALLLGADVLGRMRQVTLDFPRSRVLFGRPIS